MITTFFIIFRETLEAGLIVGIILTVLVHLRRKDYFPHVLGSVAFALIASMVAGFSLMRLTASAQGIAGKLIEGGISIIACGVLTYMVLWMDRQAKRIRPELETKMQDAITRKELFVIMSLPFLAVFREGAETVLFLSAIAAKDPQQLSLAGGLLGFGLAAAIAGMIFIGGKRVPLKALFQSSGIVLLLIAAGLLAYGIHEFQEIGFIPELYAPIWDINHILNEKQGAGALLKAVFGYNGNPSLTEVVFYWGYIGGLVFFLNQRKPQLSEAKN